MKSTRSRSKPVPYITGLVVQIQLLSVSKIPPIGFLSKETYRNKHHKVIMPVIPLELSYRWTNTLLNLRYEYGSLNRYKKTLAEFTSDRSSILTFEIGIRINRKMS